MQRIDKAWIDNVLLSSRDVPFRDADVPPELSEHHFKSMRFSSHSLAFLLHYSPEEECLGMPLWNHRHIRPDEVSRRDSGNLILAAAGRAVSPAINISSPHTVVPCAAETFAAGEVTSLPATRLPNVVYSFMPQSRVSSFSQVPLAKATPLTLMDAVRLHNLVAPENAHFYATHQVDSLNLGTSKAETGASWSHLSLIILSDALFHMWEVLVNGGYRGLCARICQNLSSIGGGHAPVNVSSPGFIDVRTLLQTHSRVRVCPLDGMHRLCVLAQTCSQSLPSFGDPFKSEYCPLLKNPSCSAVWNNTCLVKFVCVLGTESGCMCRMDHQFRTIAVFRSLGEQNEVCGANPRLLGNAISLALDLVASHHPDTMFPSADKEIGTGNHGNSPHSNSLARILQASVAHARALVLHGNSPTNMLVNDLGNEKEKEFFQTKFLQTLRISNSFVACPPSNVANSALHVLCRFLVVFVQDAESVELLRELVCLCGKPRLQQQESVPVAGDLLWNWHGKDSSTLRVTMAHVFLDPLKRLVDAMPQPGQSGKSSPSKKCRRFDFFVASHVGREILRFCVEFGLAIRGDLLSRLGVPSPDKCSPDRTAFPNVHLIFFVLAELLRKQFFSVVFNPRCTPLSPSKAQLIHCHPDCSLQDFRPMFKASSNSPPGFRALLGSQSHGLCDLARMLLSDPPPCRRHGWDGTASTTVLL